MQSKLMILRKRNGYTQKQLADYLGLSEDGFRKKESGVNQFKADEMFALSQLFDLPIEDIFLPTESTKRELI